ncbi:glycosyl hydrolase family 61-domain-containing protein [Microdochium trichocladiopsis]|uniref:lytic cellulose monooxygenase (C4-dehydrogenating) n=1 Tax=Microdochium trichocladiopsis TaxID=1682393 RepID=A0A9P8YFD7_9PEZI|nr:glycosyl hydrolase family 61-domain-containing protein [Microdochium trichocladiopsis]KAH7038313.1 glycosyl hydrolase family 61-domain-containing protein [Microdochium trichocladiopsis]
MSIKSAIALAAAFSANAVLGHGLVSGTVTDGTYNQGYILNYFYQKQSTGSFPKVSGWYAENLDNGFVDGTGYTSPDIICHKNAAPGQAVATVAAGGKIEFQWTAWPASHFGPIFTYAASCGGDCTKVDKTTLKWFKIDEVGFDVATQKWKVDDMIANNNTWVTTVPSALKAGDYVFRHEIIAMHAAQQDNGAQNYPQCVNVKVTGSGTELPQGVAGTALYTANHPGIKFNPYTQISSYQIPGPAMPAVFAKGGSGTSPAPSPSPTTTPVAPPAASSTTAPSAPSATPTCTSVPKPSNPGTELPETFTLETFISWLQNVAGKKTNSHRSHPREMKL